MENEDYAAGLPVWDQIKLLQEWAPLLMYGQQVLHEKDAYKQALIVTDALEWLAAKTNSKLDDEVVNLIAGVAHTPQGEALIRWAVSKVEGAK